MTPDTEVLEPDLTAEPAPEAGAAEAEPEPDDADLLEELLVEEVSIDGMCGVY